jgi:hypothetical protein
LILLLLTFFAVHVMMMYPKITRNAMRVAALCLLMGGMVAMTALHDTAGAEPDLCRSHRSDAHRRDDRPAGL